MSFLQLVLSLDKTKDGFNSIMENLSIWPISQQYVDYIDTNVGIIEQHSKTAPWVHSFVIFILYAAFHKNYAKQ